MCLPLWISPACITPLFNLAHLALSSNAALPPHTRLQISYLPSAHFVSLPSASFVSPHVSGCFSILPASSPSPDSLRVFQWNAGGLRARSQVLSSSQGLRCISASSWGPSKESFSLLYKAFLRPFLAYAPPG